MASGLFRGFPSTGPGDLLNAPETLPNRVHVHGTEKVRCVVEDFLG
jgi:hypothetical protein